MAKNNDRYDFGGWATKANIQCSDGRIIMRDAFKDNDGEIVPLVWNHSHNDPTNVLGHSLLENRSDGVYAYCTFNDTEQGKMAKQLVEHGDIAALSIYANKLKQRGSCVMHGDIKEVSLVLAGANPGACIDSVICHGEESEDEAIIYTGEELELCHAERAPKKEDNNKTQNKEPDKEDMNMADKTKNKKEDEETVGDVWNSLTEKQKTVVYALIGQALEENGGNDDEEEEEDDKVKHNLFDNEDYEQDNYLSHADEENILNIAKSNSCGSLQDAIGIYAEQSNALSHGIADIESLFPDYQDVKPGAPELITKDQGWVGTVMSKCEKSPISRIRTRFADVRGEDLRGFGYVKGKKKQNAGNIKLIKRTTDPQTVYRKDALNRDDIVDITDFDVVEYQYNIMKQNLNEEIATAILIGDGREDGDEMKISEDHIRSIWHDDDLYTIHARVNVAATKKELQGTNTSANFGDNYIYAEAIISAALYAREGYKGSGSLDFFCTPHLLNVMLLARDMNGRRIYESKADLAAALNVGNIYTVEQFEGKQRHASDGENVKLLGIFVNLSDYRLGATKGGQITRFNQFDIDFNQEKYLIETRLSGALTKVYSAIALEEGTGNVEVTDELPNASR